MPSKNVHGLGGQRADHRVSRRRLGRCSAGRAGAVCAVSGRRAYQQIEQRVSELPPDNAWLYPIWVNSGLAVLAITMMLPHRLSQPSRPESKYENI